jgi:hypothetical protein
VPIRLKLAPELVPLEVLIPLNPRCRRVIGASSVMKKEKVKRKKEKAG